MNVPCNGCSACCQGPDNWELRLHPDDDPSEFITYERDGHHYLGRSIKHGGCVYLVDNKCTIYEQRPWICRAFDCRVLITNIQQVNLAKVPYRVKLGAMLCWERSHDPR